MEKTKHSFKYWQWRILITTMIGYSLFYFVRKPFSFAMPGLTAEYGISKTSLGLILTIIGVIYGFSRYFNGIIADRRNARTHMSIGLFLCAIANFAFGFGVDIASLITGQTSGPMFTNTLVLIIGLLLVFNNIFQGAGYPPCARLMSHWVPPTELATKQSIWNASHSIGAALVAILCGFVMGHLGENLSGDAQVVSTIAANLGLAENDPHVIDSAAHFGAWKWCFWIPAMIAFAGAVLLLIFLRDTPSSVGLPELDGTESKSNIAESGPERRAFLRRMVYGNKYIWALAASNFFVYVVRFSVLDWGPTFLKEARGLSLASAGWSVAVFEIFGIVGTLVAGWITDHLFKGQSQKTCFWCMVGTALFMTIFFFLPASTPMWVMIITLAFAGFCIYGPQALVCIAATNQATKKGAATASGLVGIFGYISVLVSGIGVGIIVDSINKVNPGAGWNYVFVMMIGVAIIGAAIFAALWKMKANAYDEI